jgi:transposase
MNVLTLLKQVLLFISLCSTHTFRTQMVKTARLSVQQRTEIGESVNKNKSVAQLARQLKVSEPTIKRWQEESLKPRPNYSDRPGRGRKRIFNTEQVGVIKGWARKGAVVKKIAGKAYKRFDTKASKSTFHRVLKSGRYPLVFARVRREKKLSEDN